MSSVCFVPIPTCGVVASVEFSRLLDRERRVDPAVGVEHVTGHLRGAVAVDRISDILMGRHQQREDDEHHGRHLVVQPEDVVVRANVVQPQHALHGAEDVEHDDCGSETFGFGAEGHTAVNCDVAASPEAVWERTEDGAARRTGRSERSAIACVTSRPPQPALQERKRRRLVCFPGEQPAHRMATGWGGLRHGVSSLRSAREHFARSDVTVHKHLVGGDVTAHRHL